MAIDPQALSELWRRYAPPLLLLARSRCRCAEDCVQEAFVRLSTQETVPDDPPAWLMRVVRNAAIDAARSESRRKKREGIRAAETAEWFDSSVSSSCDLVGIEVQSALASIGCEDREIVVAHVWGGMTFRQIGEAFAISSSSAHRRYVEAIQQLKTMLVGSAHKPQ